MRPKAFWRRCGEQGLLCPDMPESVGGAGLDFRANAIVLEETSFTGSAAPTFGVHSDIVAPYILHNGSEAQKRAWLPRMASGEVISGIGMTEPGTGSDLAGVRTTARRDGDAYVIKGPKIFISNGQIADLVIVVAKTDPKANPPHRGISLILGDLPIRQIRRDLADRALRRRQVERRGELPREGERLAHELAVIGDEIERAA